MKIQNKRRMYSGIVINHMWAKFISLLRDGNELKVSGSWGGMNSEMLECNVLLVISNYCDIILSNSSHFCLYIIATCPCRQELVYIHLRQSEK